MTLPHQDTKTGDRCPRCDRPKATESLYEHARKCTAEPDSPECSARGLCYGGTLCAAPAVDWRERCLAAESALSIMQTDLGPELLAALVEESTE